MATFLETSDIYRLFQRELPQGVYPDGSPSGFFSTASIYSKSSLIEEAYDNLEVIYLNMFPQTANEQQAEWEIKVFGYTLDGHLTLAQRQNLVLGKLRSKPGLTIQDMINIVQSVIGTDKDVEIGEWQNESGTWLIGVSELGINTILGGNYLQFGFALWPGIDICSLTAAEVGMTAQEFEQAQYSAYSYSVLIYSYTPTAQQLAQINFLLTNGEPARSTHFIFSGLDPADKP